MVDKQSCPKANKLVQAILAVMVGNSICMTKESNNMFFHHVHKKSKGWCKISPKNKPYVQLCLQFDKKSCSSLQMVMPKNSTKNVTISAMADTGASVCMSDRSTIREMGLTEEDLTPCAMELTSADKSNINILGALPVIISDSSTGLTTNQIMYVSNIAS